ncbi:hypothetical protein LAZ67_10004173 [Cordylochernes scorpioides]|uniref:Cuticle protein 14 n=1 Tax=Cordylochernes scorpioides TaxID=51811 RepID=A0ABY6L0W7_9ARAC|nr:hypothetical protein LAZ67_10004173 [Cordylochernes scorpioides]
MKSFHDVPQVLAVLLSVVAASRALPLLHSAAVVAPVYGTGASTQFRTQDNLGNYAFGYDEGHATGGTFRRESGSHGVKVGSYGLRDIDGRMRVVNYVADAAGFRADIKTNEPGVEPKDPAATLINKAPAVAVAPAVPVGPAVVPADPAVVTDIEEVDTVASRLAVAHAAPLAHAPAAIAPAAYAHAPAAAIAHAAPLAHAPAAYAHAPAAYAHAPAAYAHAPAAIAHAPAAYASAAYAHAPAAAIAHAAPLAHTAAYAAPFAHHGYTHAAPAAYYNGHLW